MKKMAKIHLAENDRKRKRRRRMEVMEGSGKECCEPREVENTVVRNSKSNAQPF